MDYSLKIKQVALKVELFFRGLGSKIVGAYNKHVKLGDAPVVSQAPVSVASVQTDSETETEEIVGVPKDRDE